MKLSYTLMLGGAVAALSAPALAQVDGAGPQAGDIVWDSYGEDLVVTATRRAERSQDVPIAVSVVGTEQIANSGISDIRGLRQLTPSLQATTGQSAATGAVLSIRGIGTAGDNPGFEPAVGVFIDGVYRARSGIALAELPPIDRVEVLRGPQGTLFGRNTSAGALSITTAMPSFTFGGHASIAYGNYDEIEAQAGVTGPVSESIALRIDGGYHKRDGYIRDVNSTNRINDVDRWFVRGQALWETESASFRLIGDYSRTDEQCCGAINSAPGVTGPVVDGLAALAGLDGIVQPFDPDARRMAVTPGRDYREAVRDWGVSGELNLDFGGTTLTSITAWREWKVIRNQDIEFSGLDRAYRDDYRTGLRDFTQEIRFQGSAFNDRLDWLIGGFYLNEKLTLTDTVRLGTQADLYVDNVIRALSASAQLPTGFQLFGTVPGVPLFGQVALATNPQLAAAAAANPALFALFNNPLPATPAGSGQQADRWRVDTEAFAVFTHNIISLTDDIKLTLGLRYNRETKDITADLNSIVPACSFFNNPATALYTNALRAAAPSAILLACNPTVNSEFNGSYSDGRTEDEFTGTARLAIRLTDDVLLYGGYDHGYKSGGYNLDRGTFDSVVFGGNGAQMTDLEFSGETVDAYEIGIKTNLTRQFQFNISAFHQTFHDYQNLRFRGNNFVIEQFDRVRSRGVEVESVLRPTPNLTFNLGYTYLEAVNRDQNAGFEFNRQLTNQPHHVVTASMTWTPRITDSIGGLLHIDSRTNSDAHTYNDPAAIPFTTNDGYTIVNARIGLDFNDGAYGIEAYVENLFDETYYITSFPVPEQVGSYAVYPSTPRFYGVKLRARF